MSSEIAIRVNDLSKCYQIYEQPRHRLLQMLFRGKRQFFREFWALQRISFHIKRGETVGIIGRNGSGKSTLLQLICGTLTPTTGSVETIGRVAALLELGAGFNPEFTGRENILFNATILGMSPDEIEHKIDDIADFSELGHFLDQPVKTYSSGMYVRLAFAISVHVSPQVLIVDEALAVGDARFQAKCMRRIKEMRETGVTILFVSHDVSSVRALCDRAIWLDQGKLTMQGDVFPVTGAYIERLFEQDRADSSKLVTGTAAKELPVEQDETSLARTDAVVVTSGSSETTECAQTIDRRPTTHWGSHCGCILSARLFSADSLHKNQDVFEWNQRVVIRITFRLPPEIDRKNLSVAFSIKDLKGTDLIVSTTHDFDKKDYSCGDSFCVDFSFTNLLVEGKYLLVAALENRHYNDIHYYEFIEGAHYFSVISPYRLFGVAQPEIRQSVQSI